MYRYHYRIAKSLTIQQNAIELEPLLKKSIPVLKSLEEKDIAAKPSPEKWSKKEIIGHLDPAQSNIRLFVVAQYEDSPIINYNQEKWVAIPNYQHWDRFFE